MSKSRFDRVQASENCRMRALELLDAGHTENAVVGLRCAVECNPRNSKAWNDLGVVMETLGYPQEAVRCYRRAIALEPGRSEASQNLGMLLMQFGMAQALQRQAFTSSMAF